MKALEETVRGEKTRKKEKLGRGEASINQARDYRKKENITLSIVHAQGLAVAPKRKLTDKEEAA